MNATFGRYVYPTYSFVQGGDGGMEYGMCTMILGEARSLENLLGLMIHEGAHSWYQQMLATNESTKPWLDEGFTSYAEDFVMNALFPKMICQILLQCNSVLCKIRKIWQRRTSSLVSRPSR